MQSPSQRLPWTTVDGEAALPGMGERVTHPEFQGIEFVHVRAKSLLNHVPAAAGMPFEWTINTYRGCTHACTYCLAGHTPILLADGRTRPIADVRPGDRVYGTVRHGAYRRYVTTEVRDQWRTLRRAYRVTLADGTTLVSSGDHRFLTERGWKHVADTFHGQRPHLTTSNRLRGIGAYAPSPALDDAYRRGYVTGVIRGDGSIGTYRDARRSPGSDRTHRFRLALCDTEALDRTAAYLEELGVQTWRRRFNAASARRRESICIGTNAAVRVDRVRALVAWPAERTGSWTRGFLAGIFDAEGSCNQGVLRIHNTDRELLDETLAALERCGFRARLEAPAPNGCRAVHLQGGLRERLRFFHTTDPAITRKRSFEGRAVRGDADLRVVGVEDLGVAMPMYDLTTGTGDFLADGVISHNCFARPTHRYLELDPGREFESVIVVKVNAVERLRAELRAPRWGGHHVALGTNTDPYQRCEGRYRLTRGVIETLTTAGNPFSVLTKGTLVTRDLDVLADAAARGLCTSVSLSIPTLDDEVWRLSEPGTPHPRRRLETVRALHDAGIPTGVMVAPIMPGLSDGRDQLEAVVRGAIEAGASSITPIVLHLRPGVKELVEPWLAEVRPDLLERYRRLYRGSRAARAERERIGATVRALVAAHGGVSPAPRHARQVTTTGHDVPYRQAAVATGEDTADVTQLSLL